MTNGVRLDRAQWRWVVTTEPRAVVHLQHVLNALFRCYASAMVALLNDAEFLISVVDRRKQLAEPFVVAER